MLGECQMLLKSLTAHTFKVLPQLKYADYLVLPNHCNYALSLILLFITAENTKIIAPLTA